MRSTAVSRQDDSGQGRWAPFTVWRRASMLQAAGPQTPEGAWPMAKELLA